MNGPIFIIGCGRSGTSLLRLMLNSHSQLAIPPESHFIYQSIRKMQNGKWKPKLETLDDYQYFVDFILHHEKLKKWQIPDEKLSFTFKNLPKKDYREILGAIFKEYSQQKNKLYWGDKTPMNVLYIRIIKKIFPTAKFIHIIRDGRAVCNSLLKNKKWGPRSIWLAGYYWKWLTLSGIICGSMLGSEHYKEVYYEDLVQEPEKTLWSICQWLELDYSSSMLEYYKTPEALRSASKSQNRLVKNTPEISRLKSWQQELPKWKQQVILFQSGDLLDYLGYENSNNDKTKRKVLQIKEILSLPLDECCGSSKMPLFLLFLCGNLKQWSTNIILRQNFLIKQL